MQLERQSLLIGVLIGAVLCVILGSSNQHLMGILAIVALVETVFRAVQSKPKS